MTTSVSVEVKNENMYVNEKFKMNMSLTSRTMIN
jgi:hypothetical protein